MEPPPPEGHDADAGSVPPAAGPASTLGAADLLPLVYEQLRELARHRMAREGAGHTLQATALVHDVYLRLSGAGLRFADRAHFFRTAAEAMRRLLIEHARGKGRARRGGDVKRIPINVLDLAAAPDPDQTLALDEAVGRLEAEAPTAGAVVRLRFYAGLSVDEAAELLGVSPRTVDREWAFARAWLFRALEEDGAGR